jgi:hypothetical protein
MKHEIRRIGIWSLTRVSFFVFAVLGFIFGIFAALYLSFIFAVASAMPSYPGSFDPGEIPLGILFVLFPIGGAMFGAVFYTLIAVLAGALYNGFSKLVGGIELTIEPVAEPTRPAVPPAAPGPALRPATSTAVAPATPPPPPPPPVDQRPSPPPDTNNDYKGEPPV